MQVACHFHKYPQDGHLQQPEARMAHTTQEGSSAACNITVPTGIVTIGARLQNFSPFFVPYSYARLRCQVTDPSYTLHVRECGSS